MTNSAQLLFLAGSTRAQSVNKKLAKAAEKAASELGLSGTFVDLADFQLPLFDGDFEASEGVPEAAYRLKEVFCAHQGIFLACPEYNASITPLLKNALDWVTRARDEGEDPKAMFSKKLFALGAATPGGTGGIRGLVHVRYTLEYGLGAFVMPDQFLLPRANGAFSDNGDLENADMAESLKRIVRQLAQKAAAFSD